MSGHRSFRTTTTVAAGAVVMLLAVALLLPTPAAATFACSIKATSDGFLALRAAPDAHAQLVYKMPSGELFNLASLAEDGADADPTGKWLYGWYPHPETGEPMRGWASKALLTDCG